jgi:hypothetical protein
VKSSATGTDTSHGVRQTAPFDVRASAPGGLELIVKVSGGGCPENRSKVGMPEKALSNAGMLDDTDEQHDSKPQATSATARLMFRSLAGPQPEILSNVGFSIEAYAFSRIRTA